MEEMFTKFNLNGVEKYVSAIYDGAGNVITTTYETKEGVTTLATSINERIDTTNANLEELEGRVTTTEGYQESISKNTTDIQTNTTAISEIKAVDAKLREDLDTLTIKVGDNTTNVGTVQSAVSAVSMSILTIQNDIATLKGKVNDEASGIDALNTQADTNTATIGQIQGALVTLQGDVDSKVNTTVFTPVSEKVVELENAVAALQAALDAALERITALETPVQQPEDEPAEDPESTPDTEPEE